MWRFSYTDPMTRQFTARRLDVKVFAEEAGTLAGENRIGDFPRVLLEMAPPDDAEGITVKWSATGEMRNPGHLHPEVWLRLQGSAVLPLTCQRCLGTVEMPVEFDRPFRFVADEATAAAEDEGVEEDILALSRAFDLMELIEDELLLAMPLAPFHETCPTPVTTEAVDADFESANASKPGPFAALDKLKLGKH